MAATKRPLGLTLVGCFALIAGLGEIVVGFTGNYLHILARPMPPSISTGIVGAFYSLGGLFILTGKRWGVLVGVLFVAAEIGGRIYLVSGGIAPSTGADAVKILVGGIVAVSVIVYALSHWRRLPSSRSPAARR